MSTLRRFTNFVLQGRIFACAIAFILAFIPIIGSVSILIAGLVTLRKGAFEGALVFLAATVPYVLSYYNATPVTADINLAAIAFIIFTISNSLMWFLACLLRRYSSWSFVLDWAMLLAVLAIGMIHFLYPDIKDWWGQQLTEYFSKTTAMMRDIQPNAEAIPAVVQGQIVSAIKVYATGLLFASMLFNALVQLLIARWWQAIIFNPGELRKELLSIRLSYIAGLVFFIIFPLAHWGNEIAMDVIPVVYLVFSAAGLSIIHCLLAKRMRALGIVFLYIGLIGAILFPGGINVVALLFSLVGFFDIGINFRKRFATQEKNGGSD